MRLSTFLRAAYAAAMFCFVGIPLQAAITSPAHAQSATPAKQTAPGGPAKTTRAPANQAASEDGDAERGRLRRGVVYDCERAAPPECGKSCHHDKINNICVRAGN